MSPPVAIPDPDSLATELSRLVGYVPVYVALSGGLDSVVLLDLLVRTQRVVGAVHVDHGLQPESDRWARFCADLCRAQGIDCQIRRIALQPGANLEARARAERYAAFESMLPDGAVIATAHHRDDQAETVILRLLRGGGVEGLAGIAGQRRQGKQTLVRPLLGWGRTALREYARVRSLRWVEDPSNKQQGHDRNYLRHEILPRLEQRWPDVPARMVRVARHAAGEREMAHWALGQLGIGVGALSIDCLYGVPADVTVIVVREWLRQGGYRPPPEARLRQGLCDLVHAAADRQPRLAWSDGELRRHRGRLHRLPPGAAMPASRARYPMSADGLVVPGVGSLGWRRVVARCGLPRSLIPQLTLSFDFTGGRLRLRAGGGQQRLKELYRQRGIASWERGWLPVLSLEDRVVAVPGFGVDAGLAVAGGWRPIWEPWPIPGADFSLAFIELINDCMSVS